MSAPAHSLSLPHVRRDLQHYLQELQAEDPRKIWKRERENGLVPGIDQVFHFFFDDHPFDEADVGAVFINREELEVVEGLKRALDDVLEAVGDEGDDEFVRHPLWQNVTRAADNASRRLSATD